MRSGSSDAAAARGSAADRAVLVARSGHKAASDLDGPAIAVHRARVVAKVRVGGPQALRVADLQERRRQFAPQGHVVLRVARELLEIVRRGLDHQRPRLRRARGARDRVVHVEQERVRQLPHVLEPALREVAFTRRDPGLPPQRRDTARQQHEEACRQGQRERVPADEAARDVGRVAAPRLDGMSRAMTFEVARESIDRRIPRGHVAAQGARDDRVEIARQTRRQIARRRVRRAARWRAPSVSSRTRRLGGISRASANCA